MRKLLTATLLLIVSACHQHVVVPTAQQLMANPKLLAEWQGKCDTGEYSQLPTGRKDKLCFTTRSATISVAERKNGEAAEEFYRANTLRK